MFKNMLKRAWLSVIRKPSRSIIIGLILFAMSNLVLASIIIKSAVNESTEYAKASLGGTVTLSADMGTLREEMKAEAPQSGEKIEFTRPTVSKAIADKIAGSDYVKDYTYSITSKADSDSISAVENSSSSMSNNFPDMGAFGGAEESGDFEISGINSYAFISGVKNGTMEITDGEYFDESSEGKAIVSVDLAEENELSVGDKIAFTNIYTDDEVELEIIGIYDVSENNANANTIYMNVTEAAKFLSSDDYNDGDYGVENVKYELTTAENAEAFLAEIENNYPELAEENIVASEDTSAYDQMVGPIESVGSFATTILVIVLIASVAIVTLIVTINVKDRRYEMGVLLSLGAKKKNIIGQIFAELALVGTVAFLLGCGTSTILAKAMGQGILESQIASAETEVQNNFGRPTTADGMGMNFGGGPNDGGVSEIPNSPLNKNNDVEVVDEIDINAKFSDFVLLFVCGYSVILFALLIPSMNVLRYQPKEILQGKE